MNRPICTAISKRTGTQCKGRAIDAAQKFCVFHSMEPYYLERRKKGISAGGKASKSYKLNMKNFQCRDADDVKKLVGSILTKVGNGSAEFTPSIQKTLPQYAKLFLEASREVNHKRLQKLEEELKRLKAK